MSTNSSRDRVEVVSERSLQFEEIGSLSTNKDISSSRGLKSDTVNDFGIVAMELNNIFVVIQLQNFFLDSMLDLISNMLASFNMNVLVSKSSRSGVVNLKSINMLMVDPEVNLVDLLVS